MALSGLGIYHAPIAIHDVGRWLRGVLSGQFARGLRIAPGRFGLGQFYIILTIISAGG